MNKRTLILIGAFLLLISGGVLAHTTLKQKVSWSPETLNLPSLKPGESTTTSVVLTNASILANQKINGKHLTFQTTSGAGTTIAATATFPKKFEPGQKVTVTLVVSVASSTPGLPPRVIAGKVQLVKKEGDDDNSKKEKENNEIKIFEKPLLVNIAVSSIPLPPFPDMTANNATIEGIDSDANGVRDDIDWYVVATYPDSAKVREALKQEARALTPFLLDAGDKTQTRANNLEENKAYPCLIYVTGNNLDFADKTESELRAQFLNTKERSRAYNRADGQLGGTSSGYSEIPRSQYNTLCAFDPDSLPN